ncbi:hypothetical protein KFK09_028830 [Dendrobium nobile]|uniref:Uncharacterized protein n=1 Tax=Dendrobium nobile TaxID=94219 RepID=A0A8T3A4F9_DENNO|nr:hypothetical protein KFK09_028830 [Dendrobium nobile]
MKGRKNRKGRVFIDGIDGANGVMVRELSIALFAVMPTQTRRTCGRRKDETEKSGVIFDFGVRVAGASNSVFG